MLSDDGDRDIEGGECTSSERVTMCPITQEPVLHGVRIGMTTFESSALVKYIIHIRDETENESIPHPCTREALTHRDLLCLFDALKTGPKSLDQVPASARSDFGSFLRFCQDRRAAGQRAPILLDASTEHWGGAITISGLLCCLIAIVVIPSLV